eukprot:SAG31_NODE_3404_length_4312_cov_3.365773_5_plen_51_part_00
MSVVDIGGHGGLAGRADADSEPRPERPPALGERLGGEAIWKSLLRRDAEA